MSSKRTVIIKCSLTHHFSPVEDKSHNTCFLIQHNAHWRTVFQVLFMVILFHHFLAVHQHRATGVEVLVYFIRTSKLNHRKKKKKKNSKAWQLLVAFQQKALSNLNRTKNYLALYFYVCIQCALIMIMRESRLSWHDHCIFVILFVPSDQPPPLTKNQ